MGIGELILMCFGAGVAVIILIFVLFVMYGGASFTMTNTKSGKKKVWGKKDE